MKSIDLEDVKRLRHNDVPIINVLPEEAYAKKHIADTPNVPYDADDFEQRVEKIAGGKDQPVVVYCANEQCDASPKAAKKLEEAGFQDVADFEGGTQAWEQAGLATAGKAA